MTAQSIYVTTLAASMTCLHDRTSRKVQLPTQQAAPGSTIPHPLPCQLLQLLRACSHLHRALWVA
jgi:hypothetical protein